MQREASKEWLCTRFLDVEAHTQIENILDDLVQSFSPFILVRNAIGQFQALVATPDFLKIYENIRARESLLLPVRTRVDSLFGERAKDFYVMDLDALKYRSTSWLNGLPEHNVLLAQNKKPVAIVPQIHFRDWLNSLRQENPSPRPSL